MKTTKSPLEMVILGLIPYTRENMLLAFRPNQFFNELDKASKYKKQTLKLNYYRAQKYGLLGVRDGVPYLTKKGEDKIKPFTVKSLGKGAKLMVVFDIPEEQAYKRKKFRTQIRFWGFEQIQKSVWVTNKDYKIDIKRLTDELGIKKYVKLYGVKEVTP